MQTKHQYNQGFTLLEVIITAAIVSIVSMISVSAYTDYIETSKNSQAALQIKALSLLIDDYALEYGKYPQSLKDIDNENLKDPWGNTYIYLNLKAENGGNSSSSDSSSSSGSSGSSEHDGSSSEHDGMGGDHDGMDGERTNIGAARKDGNLVPINTHYDLCSSGKDSKTKTSLRTKESQDDIIYANDGAYIGLVSEF